MLITVLNIGQKHDMHNMGPWHRLKKRATSFLNKRYGTQFYDWKPMYLKWRHFTQVSRRTIQIQRDFQELKTPCHVI